MKWVKLFLFYLLFGVMYYSGFGQISFTSTVPLATNPLEVCNEAQNFSVTITNNGGTTATGGQLTVNFPDGIIYGGTVSGATYVSGSDPVILSVPNISGGGSITVNYSGFATCNRINEPVNTNTIVYSSSLGSFNHNTISYNVSYAALSITSVTNNNYYGSQGDVFTRDITIYNGGFGSVQQIKMDEVNTNGLLISSVSGGAATSSAILPATSTTFTITDFTGIGNGDIYFDNGESIIITEVMQTPAVPVCISGNTWSTTDYAAYYGCNGVNRCAITNSTDIAGYAVANTVWYSNALGAYVNITIPVANIPTCPSTPIVYTINLQNTGTDTAENGLIYIYGVDEKYFDNVTLNGVPVSHTVENAPGSCFTSYPATAGFRLKVDLPDLLPGSTNVMTVEGVRCTNNNFCYENGEGYYAVNAELFFQDNCNAGGYSYAFNGGVETSWSAGGDSAHLALLATGGVKNEYLIRDGEIKTFCLQDLNLDLFQIDTDGYVEFDIPLVSGLTWLPGYNVTFSYDDGTIHPIAPGYPQKLWNGTDSLVRVRLLKSDTPSGYQFFSEFEDGSRLCFDLKALPGVACGGHYFTPGLRIAPDPSCSPATYSMWNCSSSWGPTFWVEHSCFEGVNAGTPCEGLNIIEFDIKRKTLGYMDPDNDNVAGGSGVLDSTQIAWEHTIKGDTVMAAYKSVVYNPNGITNWNYAYVYLPFWGATVDVTPEYLYSFVSIYDASSGSYIVTNNSGSILNFWDDQWNSRIFLADLTPCLPPGFAFDQGDSIIFNSYYKFMSEPTWSHTGVVGVQNFVSAQPETDYQPWTGTQFGCSGYPDEYYHHSVQHQNYVNVNASPSGCQNGQIEAYSSVYFDQAWQFNESLFPYEVRRPVVYTDWVVALPQGANFVSATYRVVNPQGNYSSYYPISPVSNSGGVLVFDMSPLYTNNDWNISVWGVNQIAQLYVDFVGTCGAGPYNNLPVIFNADFEQPISSLTPGLTLSSNYSLSANSEALISMTVNNPYVYTNNDTVRWNMSVYSGSSAKSNIWIAKKPTISGVTIHEIIRTSDWTGSNPPPQSYFPNANGVFELGDFSGYQAENYTIVGTFTNCNKDSVTIMGGFSCTGYPTDISNPLLICNKTEQTLYVSPSLTSLQQIITVDAANDNPHQLCDTLDYQIALSSVQSGDVKNLKTYFVMSPSSAAEIIAGTSELEYPHNSGTWYTLQNPTQTGSTYCWNISADPAIAGTTLDYFGLVGISGAPLGINRLNIRFRAVSVPCSFKSGSTFLFTSEGTKPCGEKIFATDQITQPVEIPGAPVPHNLYTVKLTNTDASPCTNQMSEVRFSAVNNGPFMSGSTEFVDFIVYSGGSVAGVLTPINNAPSSSPTILNVAGGTIYRYPMPSGVLVGDSVVFTLPVQVNPNLSCDTSKVRIEASTNISFNATCITNGQTCNMGQVTGQDNDNYINVSRTYMSLSNLTAYTLLNPPSGETLNASVQVTNSGSINITSANPITVQFYKDSDLSGTVSSGDVLLGSQTQSVNLPASSSITVNFSQNVAAGTACPLLATIMETPCYCNKPLIATTNVQVEPDSISLLICPGSVTAPIGTAPITGYTYDWVAVTPGANTYLSATNIANPTFSKPTNTSGAVEYITYNLYIDRGVGCPGVQTVVVAVDEPANCPLNYGSIGNFIWEDTDGNGLQNEPVSSGINGINVQLYVVGPDGLIGTADDTLKQTVVTVNNGGNPGYYLFDSLYSATYYVHFPTTTTVGGNLTTQNATAVTDGNSDANVTTGNSVAIDINTNGSGVLKDNMTIDAGYIPTLSLGNRVWIETDNDGIYEPASGDLAMDGVKVNLYSDNGDGILSLADGSPIASQITFSGGQYLFTSLNNGNYIVAIDNSNFISGGVLEGLQSTNGNGVATDPDNNIDNDDNGEPVGGFGVASAAISLSAGSEPVNDGDNNNNSNLTLDFGFYCSQTSVFKALVTSHTTDKVEKYDFISGVSEGTFATGGGMSRPYGMIFGSGGDLLVTSSFGDEILRYNNNDGSLIGTFVSYQSGGLDDPRGLTYGPDGNLYVNSYATNQVKRYNGTTGAFIDNFITDAGLSGPHTGILFAPNGLLYVSSFLNDQVRVYNAISGDLVNSISFASLPDMSDPEKGPRGLTLGPDGNIYVGCRTDVIYKINTSTHIVSGFATGTGLLFSGLKFGPDGDLYAVAVSGDRVQKFDGALGTDLGRFDVGGTLGEPKDISFFLTCVTNSGSVGNYIWNDTNGNGLQDEPVSNGINNLSVELWTTGPDNVIGGGDDVMLQDTLTANNGGNPGYYNFTINTTGNYYIKFPLTSGSAVLTTSTPTAGLDGNSDINRVTGNSPVFTIDVNGTGVAKDNPTIDGGYYTPAQIGNFVWNDTDKDGVQDAGEPGVSGVTVILYNNTGEIISTTQTDAYGAYNFTVAPGSYTVGFQLPADYVFSPQNQGGNPAADSDVNPLTGQSGTITVVSGDVNNTIDGGVYYQPSVTTGLGNYVWLDTNGNGLQDNTEKGVASVQVSLMNLSGEILAGTVTNGDGYYQFTGLNAGSYIVSFSLPSGFVFTSQNLGANDSLDSDVSVSGGNLGQSGTIVLGANTFNPTIDAGIVPAAAGTASVGDYIWNDLNQNGIQEVGEPGLSGITVTLYDVSGTPVSSVVTNELGYYMFTNLPAGIYSIGVSIPSGYSTSPVYGGSDDNKDSDISPSGVTEQFLLTSGEVNTSIDGGVYQTAPSGTASLGNYVWYDVNQNGVQDLSESGVSGVTVTLYNNSGSAIAHTMTDASGQYYFVNLPAGTYSVGFSNLPDGYIFTQSGTGTASTGSDSDENGRTASVTLTPGQSNYDLDAGIISGTNQGGKGSIGDFVWYDVNNNGIQDAGEPGAGGVTLTLYASDMTTVLSETTTGDDGYYIFNNLEAGSYYVGISTLPSGFGIVTANAGSSDTKDSDMNPSTQMSSVITLGQGESDLSIDAGIYSAPGTTGSIGDFVWSDQNGNGIQDLGESGIGGITVTLYDLNGNPVMTTVTDENGNYLFVNVPAGEYVIGFSNVPSGFSPTLAGQGSPSTGSDIQSNGLTVIFTLNPGENKTDIDAGYIPSRATIGDYVWYDENRNGIQDGTENGVAGVTVTLYDNNGNPVSSAVTDGNGNYLFVNVIPGTYTLGFGTYPDGMLFTAQNQGPDDSDSDVNSTTGMTSSFTVASGDYNLSFDAGLITPAFGSLYGYVWNDSDKDGVQDINENAVPGVIVTLYDGAVVVATTITDGNGMYYFNDITPGTYTVGFSNLPSNTSFTSQNTGGDDTIDSDVNLSTGLSGTYTITAGQNTEAADAGIISTLVSVGNYVWIDSNSNGTQDVTEQGVAGVQVSISNASGDVLYTTQTNATGYYQFSNLVAGDYSIQFHLPSDYVFTTQGTGTTTDSDADVVTGQTDVFTLIAGNDRTDIDAGVIYTSSSALASLGDYVWYDTNNNGLQDVGEKGVSNVLVVLYDGFGNEVAYTLTNSAGEYLFQDLSAGNYQVGFSLPSGYSFTSSGSGGTNDSDASTSGANFGKTGMITLSTGQSDLNWDAGIILLPDSLASVGNYVWQDINQDGIQDADEAGVSGVTVTLYDKQGNVIAVTETNIYGEYLFTGLSSGEYYLSFTNLPSGWQVSPQGATTDTENDSDINPSGTTAVFYVDGGDNNMSFDAGIYNPLSQNAGLGDRVWMDINSNGIQENGEYGVGGVTVNLWNAAGTVLLNTTMTNGDGYYRFIGLDAGDYRVSFENIPSGYSLTLKDQGGIDSQDSDPVISTGMTGVISLSANTFDPTIDAGIAASSSESGNGSIGDFVWNDLNQNGVQDAGEPGISGVTVTLINVSTGVVLTTETNAFGYYIFNDLSAGTYDLVFSGLPAGYVFTSTNAGSNDNRDSDTDGTGSVTVTLATGESNLSIDAGAYNPVVLGALGNYVWFDTNQNGIQDNGETGVSGVSVSLLGATGNVLQTTTTNASGFYLFTDLTAGNYVVSFSNIPTGYVFTGANTGGDDTIDSDAIPSSDGSMGVSRPVSLTAGQTRLDVDAGIYSNSFAGLGNYVWSDLDRDGVQDTNEPGVAGVTVTVYDNSGTAVANAITDANGYYLFPNLTPGDYYLGFTTLPIGSLFTNANQGGNSNTDSNVNPLTGNTDLITLNAGEINLSLDAGIIAMPEASLYGYVWYDYQSGILPTNVDGIQTAGEMPVAGVTVGLYDTGGQLLAVTVTGADGMYYFSNLVAGTYEIRFLALPAGAKFTLQNQGGDDMTDSDANPLNGNGGQYTVAAGEQKEAADAGLTPTAALTGITFIDGILNVPNTANGVFDSTTEPVLGGVNVILLDASGNILKRGKTTDDGSYIFRNLEPGVSYRVAFEQYPGGCPLCEFTLYNSDGQNDTTDSDVNTSVITQFGSLIYGLTDIISPLMYNELRPFIDAGYARAGSAFPVELLEFTAVLDNVDGLLRWTTTNEVNTSHFAIERSVNNGQSFEWLGDTDAAGNSNSLLNYTYRDLNVAKIAKDKIHYRLKMVDIDNTYKYSNTVELKIAPAELYLNVYPVPASDYLTVEYQLFEAGYADIKVVNALGQQVYNQSVINAKDLPTQKMTLDVKNWAQGVYYLEISTETKVITRKFIVE
ncbi:MAG: carboxypeptidase regulatory-like domain-containing protein [Bacteroidia bacterium]|nr:carboxypeptidase regulatory-like domain-containing protein [Bacteroidia bacterium]